jgi:hypothetical protein
MSISPKSPLKSALLGLTAAGIVAFAISALAAGPGTPSTSQQIQSDNSKQEENMPAAPAKKADGSSAKASMQSPAKQNMNRSAAAGMPADTTETDQDKKDAAGKNAAQEAARPGQSMNRSAAAGMPAACAMNDDATATDKDKKDAAGKSAAQETARPGQSMNRSAAAGMPAPSATAEEQQASQNSPAAQPQPGMARSANTPAMPVSKMQQKADETCPICGGAEPCPKHPAPKDAAGKSAAQETARPGQSMNRAAAAGMPTAEEQQAAQNSPAAQPQPGMARSANTPAMPASKMQQRADETCPICGGAEPCPKHPAPTPSK